MNIPAVTAITYHRASRELEVGFADGLHCRLAAEYLRVYSPSAEVQGHGRSEPLLLLEKERVEIRAIEPVGNYAVRLVFSDGHNTGLYSWKVLRELADEHPVLWPRYLERLKQAGYMRPAG